MLESMTGYGKGIVDAKGTSLVLELKSVNSKFLEIRSKLPKDYNSYEQKVSVYLKSRFSRGYFDVSFNRDEKKQGKKVKYIDEERTREFYRQAKQVQKKLKIPGEIGINTVLKNRDIFQHPNNTEEKVEFKVFQKALKMAADNLAKMRKKEGLHLEKDISRRVARIADLVSKIDGMKNILLKRIMERLEKRVDEIKNDIKFESGRLEQELVLYAAKADIAEEITRLKSHIKKIILSII